MTVKGEYGSQEDKDSKGNRKWESGSRKTMTEKRRIWEGGSRKGSKGRIWEVGSRKTMRVKGEYERVEAGTAAVKVEYSMGGWRQEKNDWKGRILEGGSSKTMTVNGEHGRVDAGRQ